MPAGFNNIVLLGKIGSRLDIWFIIYLLVVEWGQPSINQPPVGKGHLWIRTPFLFYWFQPIWKILVSWYYYSHIYIWKNKECSKPPTSFLFYSLFSFAISFCETFAVWVFSLAASENYFLGAFADCTFMCFSCRGAFPRTILRGSMLLWRPFKFSLGGFWRLLMWVCLKIGYPKAWSLIIMFRNRRIPPFSYISKSHNKLTYIYIYYALTLIYIYIHIPFYIYIYNYMGKL